jgi:hypothetical protein
MTKIIQKVKTTSIENLIFASIGAVIVVSIIVNIALLGIPKM